MLIHAEAANAELLLSRWRSPHNFPIPICFTLLDFGRCCLEDANFSTS